MTLSSIQSKIVQYQKELNILEQRLSKEQLKESGKLKDEARIRSSITKNTTTAIAATKNRQMENLRKEANNSKAEQARLTSAISKKRGDIANAENEYRKEDARLRVRQQAEYQSALDQQSTLIDSQRAQINKLIRRSPSRQEVVRMDEKEYDFFISHASEDKAEIATPLYQALEARGAHVWYDDFEVHVGDSLRRSIDRGVAGSKYGILILSPNYIKKYWTEKEFNAFFAKGSARQENIMLPIWHKITQNEVLKYSAMMADIKAFNSAILTIEEMADGFISLLPLRGEE